MIEQLPHENLNEVEIADLTLMREEEKLARDVYWALGDIWTFRIFANISQSEQVHMDAMLALLEKYELQDPAIICAPLSAAWRASAAPIRLSSSPRSTTIGC